jgi:hypothetical protein
MTQILTDEDIIRMLLGGRTNEVSERRREEVSRYEELSAYMMGDSIEWAKMFKNSDQKSKEWDE